eukprot:augustus_masked-scaffold_13-processed-gene-1.1-mRNA-1 protein AED:1.00 eAED:1.00 QI:0/-1/0/0/-1/1/1/0/234
MIKTVLVSLSFSLVTGQTLLVRSNCNNITSFEFLFYEIPETTVEAAKQVCFSEGGDLASIRNAQEQTIAETLISSQTDFQDIYIGVEFAGEDTEDTDEPSLYIFSDAFQDISFFDVGFGDLPWDLARPASRAEETSVALRRQDFEWRNKKEDEVENFLCRLDCPILETNERGGNNQLDSEEFNFAVLAVFGGLVGLNVYLFYLFHKEKKAEIELQNKIKILKGQLGFDTVMLEM